MQTTKIAGLDPYRQYVLARDRVRYVGEPIALVFADDAYVAEDAADLIEPEIEDLPVNLDAAGPRQALLLGPGARREHGLHAVVQAAVTTPAQLRQAIGRGSIDDRVGRGPGRGIALEPTAGGLVEPAHGGERAVGPPPDVVGIEPGRLVREVELDRDVGRLGHHGGDVGVPDAVEPRR